MLYISQGRKSLQLQKLPAALEILGFHPWLLKYTSNSKVTFIVWKEMQGSNKTEECKKLKPAVPGHFCHLEGSSPWLKDEPPTGMVDQDDQTAIEDQTSGS